MQKPLAVAIYRLSVGMVALGTVIAQTVNGFFHPPFDYPNYFSFFSIQGNLFAAFVLTASAVRTFRGGRGDNLTFWRGAATLYLTLAGTVYFVLLRGSDEGWRTPGEQTNAVLHYLVPAALLADWWLTPGARIAFRSALLWLAYPLIFVLYSLLRGRFTGWYPYPFLDAPTAGYPGIVMVCLVMAAAMIAFITLMTGTTARRAETKPRESSSAPI